MKNTKKRGSKYFIIILILLVSIIGAYSISFSSGPITSPTIAYANDDITCSWLPSADHNGSTLVNWYKDGSLSFSQSTTQNSSILEYTNTSKNELWICEVIIYNGTDSTEQNSSSLTIQNSPPEIPTLYFANGSVLTSNYTIIEDSNYSFFMNSTDIDSDTLEYSSTAGTFCSLSIDADTGNFTCNPTNDDLTEPHTQEQKSIRFFADDGATGEGFLPYKTILFIVTPINDQAEFDTVPENASILSETYWETNISGTDEESDFPLNFTLFSELNAIGEILIITSISNTTAKINFTQEPTNLYAGTWNITINLTDANGTDGGRNVTQYTFELQINSTNHDPVFLDNFSLLNLTGTQNENFTVYFTGNDSDTNNTIYWNITAPSNASTYCIDNFPWTITTINSSYVNSTALINTTLTNDHIACNYVNLTILDDALGSNSTLLTFNLTNVNDPPEIYEVGRDGNMSDYLAQTTYMFATYTYQVNASDPDNYTYDAESTANLTYYMGNENFSINSETGLITLNVQNESYVRNWSLNITVGDGEYNVSRNLELQILNNTAPILNLSQNNLTFLQNDSLIEVNFTSTEPNNQSMYVSAHSLTNFNSSIYNITNVSNNYTSDQNIASWTLNMTKNTDYERNKLVGTHILNINVSDSLGATLENVSTGTLIFTINNTNDAPFFDQDKNNVSDNTIFYPVVMNKTFTKTIYATDFDLYLNSSLSNESLNFTYENETSGLGTVSFTKTEDDVAIINFTPTIMGQKNITLIVSDSENLTAYQTITFIVLADSVNPVIEQIRPYFNDTLNQTQTGFTNASATFYPNQKEDLNISENSTLIFDAISVNDTSIPNNTLTYYWYINEVLNKTIVNATPTNDSQLDLNFSFFSNGTYNVTLEVEDQRLSKDRFEWNLTVEDVNRIHVYYEDSLEDLSVNLSTEYQDYFSYRNGKQRFYDPDEDLDGDGIRRLDENESTSLNYSVRFPELCSLASFEISGDNLRVIPSETGICIITFIAEDIYGNQVLSDDVRIDVVGAEPSAGNDNPSQQSGGSSTRTQVITVPIEEEVDKPIPIKLIAPGTVNTYYNKTIMIPITLKNTWEDAIRGIRLNLTMADQPNVTYSFENSYFPSIPAGGESSTILTISNYRTDGPFDITVYAFVGEPEFTDSVGILINSMEQTSEGEQVRTKVTFAKDMLSENSECRELNDLLDRAEFILNSGNYDEARRLVDSVINGCKFLLQDNEQIRRESPSIIQQSFDLLDKHSDKILIVAVVLTLVTIVFYIVASIKKLVESN